MIVEWNKINVNTDYLGAVKEIVSKKDKHAAVI